MVTWIVIGLIVWAAIAVATFALLSAAGRADRVRERRAAQQRMGERLPAGAIDTADDGEEPVSRFERIADREAGARSGQAPPPRS